jgi:hypothetical protein
VSQEPITPEEVKHLADAGEAVVFLDARNEESLAQVGMQLPLRAAFHRPLSRSIWMSTTRRAHRAVRRTVRGSGEVWRARWPATDGTNVRPLLGDPTRGNEPAPDRKHATRGIDGDDRREPT